MFRNISVGFEDRFSQPYATALRTAAEQTRAFATQANVLAQEAGEGWKQLTGQTTGYTAAVAEAASASKAGYAEIAGAAELASEKQVAGARLATEANLQLAAAEKTAARGEEEKAAAAVTANARIGQSLTQTSQMFGQLSKAGFNAGRDVSGGLNQAAAANNSFTLSASAAATAGVAAYALLAFQGVRRFTELAGEIRAFQRVTGESAQESSQLVYALHQMGIEPEVASKALGIFSRNLVDHADKVHAAGVEIAHLRNGHVDLIGSVYNLADAYQRLGPGAEANALAANLLGRGYQALIPLLQRGRDGLKEFFDEAKSHGLVFNQQDLTDAKNLGLATKDLHAAFTGLEIDLGKDVVPAITAVAHGLSTVLDIVHELHLPTSDIVLFGAATVVASKGVAAMTASLAAEAEAAAASAASNVELAASEVTVADAAAGTATKISLIGTVGKFVLPLVAYQTGEAAGKAIVARDSFTSWVVSFEKHIPLIGNWLASQDKAYYGLDKTTKATKDQANAYTAVSASLGELGQSLDHSDDAWLQNDKTAKQAQAAVDSYKGKIIETAASVGMSAAALSNAIGISGTAQIEQFQANEEAAKKFAQAVISAQDAASKAFMKGADAVAHFSASSIASSAKAANSVVQDDTRVADAQQRVADLQAQYAEQAATAKQQWADKVTANDQQVADAEGNYADVVLAQNQRVADADQRLADERISQAQRVADAKQRLLDDQESGAQAVRDAEERLRDLQERNNASTPAQAAAISKAQELRHAQEDVEKARKRAADTERNDREAIAKAELDQVRGVAKAQEEADNARKAQAKAVEAAEDQVTKAKAEQNKLAGEGTIIGQLTLAQTRELRNAVEAVTKAQQSQSVGFQQISADAEVTADDIKAFYAKAVQQGSAFAADIKIAIEKGYDPGFVSRLLQEGPQEAEPVLKAIVNDHDGTLRDLVNSSERALSGINQLVIEQAHITQTAVSSNNAQLRNDATNAMRVLETIYSTGGQLSAQGLADKLGMGVAEVKRIMDEYGLTVTSGVNPILAGVGAPTINITAAAHESVIAGNKSVGLTGYGLAEGGTLARDSELRGPGTVVQWAEPVTEGEYHAFIPRAGSKRKKALEVLDTAARDLGHFLVPKSAMTFAGGGYLRPEDVDRPPDLTNYGNIIGYTGGRVDQKLFDAVVEFVRGRFSPSGPVPPGSVIDWVKAGVTLASKPDSWVPAEVNIAMFESGGDPHAINLWDSNAAAGHPSKGLMQTIDSTFNAYAIPGHMDIWNPVDNVAAATGYIASRYGDPWHTPGELSLARGGSYQGYSEGGIHVATYDRGGILPPGWTAAYNGTGRGEVVGGVGMTQRDYDGIAAALAGALEGMGLHFDGDALVGKISAGFSQRMLSR